MRLSLRNKENTESPLQLKPHQSRRSLNREISNLEGNKVPALSQSVLVAEQREASLAVDKKSKKEIEV